MTTRDWRRRWSAALGDADNAGLRSACAEALARMGELAVPALTQALGTRRRRSSASSWWRCSASSAQRRARRAPGALDDKDENVRSAVADSLGRGGGDEAVELLRTRLRERQGDLQLSAYCLDALGRLGARLPLAELLPYVRDAALSRLVFPLLALSGGIRLRRRRSPRVWAAAPRARVDWPRRRCISSP